MHSEVCACDSMIMIFAACACVLSHFAAQQEGSWVIDSAVGLEQHDVLKEQLERVLSNMLLPD